MHLSVNVKPEGGAGGAGANHHVRSCLGRDFDSCVIFQGGQFDVAAIVESKTLRQRKRS